VRCERPISAVTIMRFRIGLEGCCKHLSCRQLAVQLAAVGIVAPFATALVTAELDSVPVWRGHAVVPREGIDSAFGISFVDVAQCYDSSVDIVAVKLRTALREDGVGPAGCVHVMLVRTEEVLCEEPSCSWSSAGRVFEIASRTESLCASHIGIERFLLVPPLQAEPGHCLGWQYGLHGSMRISYSPGGPGYVWWHRATPGLGEGGLFDKGEARTYSIAVQIAAGSEASEPAAGGTASSQSACRCSPALERFRLRMTALFQSIYTVDAAEPRFGQLADVEACDDLASSMPFVAARLSHGESVEGGAGAAGDGHKSDWCPAAQLAKVAACAVKAWHAGQMIVASGFMDQALQILLLNDMECLERAAWPVTTALVLTAALDLIRRSAMRSDRALAAPFWPMRPLLQTDMSRCPGSVAHIGLRGSAIDGALSEGRVISNLASGPAATWPRVACLVAFRMPDELALVEAIAESWGPRCDVLTFFMARHGAIAVLELRGGFRVVNLADLYPEMQEDFMISGRDPGEFRDPTRNSNAIEKSLHVMRWAAGNVAERAEVFCLFDSDSYVVPENIRWFSHVHGLDGDAPPRYFARLNDFAKRTLGLLIPFPEGGQGVCFTRMGLLRLGQVLEAAPYRHDLTQNWEDIHGECAYVTGHNDDLTLRFCTMEAGIVPLDVHDEFGRLFGSDTPLPCREHWNTPGLQKELENVLSPLPVGDGSVETLRESLTDAELARYLVCRPSTFRNHWLHPYAYVFHGYKDAVLLRAADRVFRGMAAGRTTDCDWFSPHWLPEIAGIADGRPAALVSAAALPH